MKSVKKYFKPFLCSIIIITIISSSFITWWSLSESMLPNGSVYSDEADYYMLSDAMLDHETGRYTYAVYLSEGQAKNLTLVLTKARDFTLYAGDDPYIFFSSQNYRRLRTIPVAPPLYDARSGMLHLEWSTAQGGYFSEGYGLFLGDTQAFMRMINSFSHLQTAFLGMLLLMLIHALSLLWNKRSEKYLLIYGIYLTSILLAVLLNSNIFENVMLSASFPYFIIVSVLVALQKCIDILMCCRLLSIELKGFPRRCLSWPGIMCFCIVYCALCNSMLPHATYIAEGIRLLLALTGAWILIYGYAYKRPYARTLLAGYSISLSMIIMASLANIEVIGDWLAFVQLRTGRIEELPFAFACMLCINRRFASKFNESERLTMDLTELNSFLDEKVEERTRDYITERQQRHGMMLNIFHDLRSPLFTLKGCIDILCSELPHEHDMIGIIKDRIRFLSTLTNDLFLLAKLEDDEMPFDCMRVSLSDALCYTAKAQRVSADDGNIEFTVDIDTPCQVWGNKEHLERAFENLIVNAIHYTPSGGKIRMSLTVNGETARVDVMDSGKGIEPEDLEKIFVKYYTSDSRSHDNSTGLGLSITKNIIERHLGSITVISKPNEGSTFTVCLPILELDENE